VPLGVFLTTYTQWCKQGQMIVYRPKSELYRMHIKENDYSKTWRI